MMSNKVREFKFEYHDTDTHIDIVHKASQMLTLTEVCDEFANFLRSIGYVLDSLEVIHDDDH